MKAFNMVCIALFTILILTSCQKPEEDIEYPYGCYPNCFQPEFPFEYIWEKPISADTSLCFFDQPKISNDQLIYIRSFCEADGVLNSRNKTSGLVDWTWSDPDHIGDGNNFASVSSMVLSGDALLLGRQKDLYHVNSVTGQTVWSYHYPEGWANNVYINSFDNVLYQPELEPSSNRIECYLLGTPKDDFNARDTVFRMEKENGYRPNLHPPSGWKNAKGETILVFQNRQWNFDAVDGKIDLYAYNLTADSLYWKIDDLVPDGNSNVRPPLIEGNSVFFLGGRTLFCIDVETGEVIWERQFNNGASGLLTSNVILAEGNLIVNPDDRTLYALDPETGTTLWSDDDSGSNCSDMVAHDGIVYFTSAGRDRLYAVDIHTGEHYWEERSPHRDEFPNAQFVFQGVAVDEETGYVYTSDKYFIMCLKPPKR